MDAETEGPLMLKVTPLQQMLSSCAGAILTSLMVTPLDVVKIRLQAQSNPFPKGKCFVYSNGLMDHMCICEGGKKAWYKKPGNFHGTWDAFLKILRNEGIKSLWSGLPPTLVMAVPATVVYFTCYEQLSALLRSKLGENETRIPIVAGIVARSRKCLKMVGFPSGRAGLLPFLEMYLSQFAAVATLPFDVVKTQKQTQLWTHENHTISVPLHMSTWAIMKNIVAENGFSGLFTGLIPRVVKIAPACAIMISTYELGKTFFQKQNVQRQ